MKMTVELFDSIINTSVLPRRTTGVTRGCDKGTVLLSHKKYDI